MKHKLEHEKKTIPPKLEKRNLTVNEDKTEEYTVKRGGDEEWKKCKYLGSLLDTEEDIKRRRMLTNDAYNKLKPIFTNRNVSLNMKIKTYNTLLESIFMYNSELWTLGRRLEKQIDVFQRKLLRRITNIKWPKKIRNDDLYKLTQQTPWSVTITARRLKWFGHLCRLPDNAPAKKALEEAQKPVRRPRGRPKMTWLAVVSNQLKDVGLTIKEADALAQDRKTWAKIVVESTKLKAST
jgi:hypothetical protein